MTVQLAQMSHLPGDTAEALVVRDGGVGEELEVQLVCRAPWLDDQRDVAQPWETATEALLTERVIAAARPSSAEAAGAESRVQLAIPVGAPPTVEGAIGWSVRARMGSRAEETADLIVRARREDFVDDLERVTSGLERSPEISLELADRSVRAGDSLSGAVVLAPEKQLKARTVSVALVNTFLLATQLVGPTNLEVARDVEVEAPESRRIDFTLAVPPDSPPSFSDRLADNALLPADMPAPVNYWKVRATVKAGRLFGSRSSAAAVHVFNG